MQHSLAQKLQSSHPHHHPASLPDLCLMHAKTNSSNYLLTQICHPPSQSKSPVDPSLSWGTLSWELGGGQDVSLSIHIQKAKRLNGQKVLPALIHYKPRLPSALVPGYSALKALLTRVPNESEHSSPPSRALGAMANQHLHLISTGAPKHILSFALAHQAHSTAY
eukprot:scaffold87622_cov14-Tisochrysis_lutea.AAC.1